MAKVVNQNDILDIIKSNINITNEIVKIVTNSNNINEEIITRVESYCKIISEFNKKDGILDCINTIHSKLSEFQDSIKPINIGNIIWLINGIPVIMRAIIDDIVSLSNNIQDEQVLNLITDFNENIVTCINGYISIIEKISKIESPSLLPLYLNLMQSKLALNRILNNIKTITDYDFDAENYSSKFKNLNEFIEKHYLIFIKNLSAIKFEKDFYKLLLIRKVHKYLIGFFNNILEFIENETVKELTSKSSELDAIIAIIDKIKISLKTIKDIIVNIIFNTINAKVFNKINDPFMPLLSILKKTIDFIIEVDKITSSIELPDLTSSTQKISQCLIDIKNLIVDIKSIIKDIIVIGLLAPILILTIPLAVLSILMLKWFINSIMILLVAAGSQRKLLRDGIKDITWSILTIALSIFAITYSLVLVALAAPILADSIGVTTLTMLAVVGMLVVIGILLKFASPIFNFAMTGSTKVMIAVLVVCGSILAVAATILLTSLIATDVLNNIGPFLAMFGVTVIILIAAVGLALVAGLVAAPAAVGLALIGLTVLGLMATTLMIKHLADPIYTIDEDTKTKILNNIKDIKTIVSDMLSVLLEGGLLGNNNNEGNRGLLGNMLNFVSPGLYSVFEIFLTFSFLATTMLSVGAIILIGNMLKSIEDIDLNPSSIKENIENIITCARELINQVMAPGEDRQQRERGLLGKLVDWLCPNLNHVVDAMSTMFILGISIISVGALALIAKELRSISDIQLSKETIVGADGKGGRVKEIIDVAKATITAISSQDGLPTRTIKDAVKLVENLEDVVDSLGDINDIFNKIYENNLPTGTPQIISLLSDSTFKQIITDISKNESLNKNTVNKAKYYNSILKAIYNDLPGFNIDAKDAKNSIDITNNYIKFIDKIDKINIEKLQTSVKMFEKMAEFSKSINGNFDKLAESLNEDLMPVLEELKTTLNKIPEKIDTNAANVSQSISTYSSPAYGPSTRDEMEKQVSKENPKLTKAELDNIVHNRLMEQARAQSQSLESKFDELIELLKSGQARMTIHD